MAAKEFKQRGIVRYLAAWTALGLVTFCSGVKATGQGPSDTSLRDDANCDLGSNGSMAAGSDSSSNVLSWNVSNWDVTAGVSLLQRNESHRQPALIDPLQPSLATLLDVGESSTAAAPRLEVTYRGAGIGELDFGLSINSEWHSQVEFGPSAFTAGVGGLQLDRQLFLPVSQAHFSYSSQLSGCEFNFRRPCNDWLTPFVGIRWLEFDDRFTVTGLEAGSSIPFAHSIRTVNNLWGGQIGAVAQISDPESRLSIDAVTEAGIFSNSASTAAGFSDAGGFGSFSANGTGVSASTLAEIELRCRWRLTKYASIRGSYQVLWLDRLAFAPTQIDGLDLISGTAAVDTRSTLFAHGATVGLEFVW